MGVIKLTRNGWAILFCVLWVITLAFGYWYFVVKPNQWFDPQMVRPPVLEQKQQQHALKHFLKRQFPELEQRKSWFIRFKQQGCSCERFVDPYHQAFVQKRATSSIQIVELDIGHGRWNSDDRRWLQSLVTSTPAVVIFDQAGSLSYFGPYHQDGVCSAENSFIEPVLQLIAEGKAISIINTLVFGCFCPVALD